MGDVVATYAMQGRRFELPFFVVSAIFWLGPPLWVGSALPLPHIYGNPSNLIGVGIVVVVAVALLVFSIFIAVRVTFEIRGARVANSECILFYRYLGQRTVRLPYRGRIKRHVRLPDLKSPRGFREGLLIYHSIVERILIPMEMNDAEDLARALTRD